MKAYLFLVSCEGVLLFPAIMLMIYFGFSIQTAVIYTLIVVGIIKILSFYKCFIIFFEEKALFANNFVLLCPRSGTSFRFVRRIGID